MKSKYGLNPGTMRQLPKTASEYYSQSIKPVIPGCWIRVETGTDDFGRKIYQSMYDGQPYGQPKALLTYSEFKKNVRFWAERVGKGHPGIGVERWTTPLYRNW